MQESGSQTESCITPTVSGLEDGKEQRMFRRIDVKKQWEKRNSVRGNEISHFMYVPHVCLYDFLEFKTKKDI